MTLKNPKAQPDQPVGRGGGPGGDEAPRGKSSIRFFLLVFGIPFLMIIALGILMRFTG